MSSRLGAAVFVCLALSSQMAAAERPRTGVISTGGVGGVMKELPPNGLVPYNKLYLNRCANGCTITNGASNSINDRWDIGATRVLSKWPYGDDAWNNVVACVKDVFSPYVIDVVTSPPSGNHFEIMIAGSPVDLKPGDPNWQYYGGVAPGYGQCSTYYDNALVFAFAKMYGNNQTQVCDDGCVNEICATAAQEIGHVWRKMDHSRLAADPMTYFGYAGRRYFQDTSAECGSDCSGGFAPSGQMCTGTGEQTHDCWCGATQNTHSIIKGLFGLGPGTPPVAKILSPKYNENVEPLFPVMTEITDDSNIINRVEFKVDNVLVTTLTRGPFVFAAPDGLAEGAHHVDVIAYDGHGTAGSSAVDVIIGPPCEGEDDCAEAFVCVGGRCVAGPNVSGGLGTTCADSTTCVSNRCASDGTNSYCVELCMTGECPSGFGCLDTGEELGVCWPGYDDSGGCGCQTSRGGPAGMIFALLVMVVTCRRRRR